MFQRGAWYIFRVPSVKYYRAEAGTHRMMLACKTRYGARATLLTDIYYLLDPVVRRSASNLGLSKPEL